MFVHAKERVYSGECVEGVKATKELSSFGGHRHRVRGIGMDLTLIYASS